MSTAGGDPLAGAEPVTDVAGPADKELALEPSKPRNRLRAWLTNLIKIGVAVGLFVWLYTKGGIEPEKLWAALKNPWAVCPVLLIGLVAISASGLRWTILLRGEGIMVPLWTVLRLTWIGHFWNMVIPGAVSGDAVKMFYIGRVAPDLREEAWMTVFADRVIGLVALVSVSILATLIGFEFIWNNPDLRLVFLLMLGVFLAACIAGTCLVLGVGSSWKIVAKIRDRLPFGGTLTRFYGALQRVGRRPKSVSAAFAISFAAHCMSIVNALLLGRAAGEATLTVTQYCVVVPIAMFSNAIPISPGGLGVGEGVLGGLFELFGGLEQDGVTVMLLLRLNFYVLAILGAVLYALYRHEGTEKAP